MFKLQILLQLIRIKLRGKFSTRENLVRFQKRKLKLHLKWVRKNSPFYTNFTETTFDKLPLMSKDKMMEHFDSLNTEGVSKSQAFRFANEAEDSRNFNQTLKKGLTVGLSSGTSGNKGIFLATKSERAQWVAEVLNRVLPLKLFKQQKIAFFLRSNSTLYESVKSSSFSFHYFDLKKDIHLLFEELLAINPSILIAPPSVLLSLSELFENKKIKSQFTKIISVAEVLETDVKRQLEAKFSQKIHQVYQATEGFLGSTCNEGVLHLHEDLIHFEFKFLDDSNTAFHPIISDFNRKTQPMIRYELNDILHLKKNPCKCGSILTAIDHIEGRSDDVLEFNAQKIYPDFFRQAVILASDNILNYRITQLINTNLLVELQIDSVTSFSEVKVAVEKKINALLLEKNIRGVEIIFKELNLTSFHDKFRRIKKE